MKRYIIECGDERAVSQTLAMAKAVAGEWQIEHERRVTVEWEGRPGQKFLAVLRPSDDTDELLVTFEALWQPAAPAPTKAGRLRYPSDVEYPDVELERARRVAIYAAQLNAQSPQPKDRAGGKPAKQVIHEASGKRFDSITKAAIWAGITRESMKRRVRIAGSGWRFETTTERKAESATVPPGDADVIAAGSSVRSDLGIDQRPGPGPGIPISPGTPLAV